MVQIYTKFIMVILIVRNIYIILAHLAALSSKLFKKYLVNIDNSRIFAA